VSGPASGGELSGNRVTEVLPPEEVHLWHVATASVETPEAVAACERVLSPDERERAARFRRPADGHLYRVAHALKRIALSRYAAVSPERWEFRRERYGKPLIAEPPGVTLGFNLSHTTGLAVVAVTSGASVGVDVEHTGRAVRVEIAREIFSADEMDALQALPELKQPGRFFALWTLKEALAKARGEGFVLPLGECRFTFAPPSSDAQPCVTFGPRVEDDPRGWRFFQEPIRDDYLAAVAVRAEHEMRLVIREGIPCEGLIP
jgi:4'-phosphopantetheinyl transferase